MDNFVHEACVASSRWRSDWGRCCWEKRTMVI